MKKIKNLTLFFLFAFLLSACGGGTSSDTESTTGESFTGISWQESITQLEVISWNAADNPQLTLNQTGDQFSDTLIQNISPHAQTSQLFPVELCNQIFDLYQCIISKAPIENQPVMQENLNQSVQSRNLMADPQLREVCQAIHEDSEFQTVMHHYTWTGHTEPCVF